MDEAVEEFVARDMEIIAEDVAEDMVGDTAQQVLHKL